MSGVAKIKIKESGDFFGAHRRIELNDIIEYDRKLSQTRNEQLDFLAKQAQELNLGY